MAARRPGLASGMLGLLLAGSLALAGCGQAMAAENHVRAPIAQTKAKESGLKTAIFAGGCFWGVEGVFSHVRGVTSAVSGYHGGTERQAHYKLVSSGITDHAEAVRVTYDPKVIRYDQLLRIFFSVVTDPTQLDRQGPDVGAHYRSAIVPLSAEQNAVAKAYLAQLLCMEKAMEIGTNGIQLFGGAGFVRDYPLEMWYRNLRSIAVLHGSLMV